MVIPRTLGGATRVWDGGIEPRTPINCEGGSSHPKRRETASFPQSSKGGDVNPSYFVLKPSSVCLIF